MTVTYSHASDLHLAKVKLGDSVYYLKDADLRTIVEAFGTATSKNYADVLTSNGSSLPTESAVYDYVVSAIGELGKVVNLLAASDHTQVANPANGDMVVEDDGKEWLYVKESGAAQGVWRNVGDENSYVAKTFEIAGLAMSSNITSSALQNALGLGSLAYKDSASAVLAGWATGIASYGYTPEGQVDVTLDQTETAAAVTTSDYTPAGSVSVQLNTDSFYTMTSEGSVGTFNAGSYSAPSVSESSKSFAVEGLTASVDSVDTEMLVFSTASTASAVYATNFDAGSYSAPSLTGLTMPVFSSYTLATGVSSASFTGTKLESTMVTGVSYSKATVNASRTSFTGSSTTFAPVLTTSNKDISVS